ncbi:hypothetical protein LTR85_006358 [Meristemomyces frigidus]|nr:hypothetical protein LTR85_006358 [Meristemomyces frigidus]
MKATSLFTSVFAASAAALSTGTASNASNAPFPTGSYNHTISNSWSHHNDQRIQELENEVEALRQQLSASQTCASGEGSSYSGSSDASSSSAASYSSPTASSGSSDTSPSGYSASSDASPSSGASAHSDGFTSALSGSSGAPASSYGSAPASTQSPAVSVAASSGSGSSGSSGAGASQASSAVSSQTTTPDFYGVEPPASTSESAVSTYTVIVTPGQSSAGDASSTAAPSSLVGGSSEEGATTTSFTTTHLTVTVTETYVGSASVPSAPSYQSSETASSQAPTSTPIIPSAPYYAGNGSASGYPTGSASAGIVTAPSAYANSTSAYLTGTGGASMSGSAPSYSPIVSANSTLAFPTGSVSSSPIVSSNSTSAFLTGTASSAGVSSSASLSANSTSAFLTGTTASASSTTVSESLSASANSTSASLASTSTSSVISTPTASAKPNTTDCSAICSTLTTFNDWDVTPMTCTQRYAGALVNTPSGESSVGCAASFTPSVDLCQITLNVKTSGTANTYMEVWLPNGNTTASTWNGRTMSTDNGGLNGCVHYIDMQYVSGLGYAAIGDNAGHNGSSFDGTWMTNNNEAIVDWAWRARHASVDVGKQVVNKFYSEKPSYSYYIGCSAGGSQGLQSAQKFPNDFDGIISGASANDFNHLQDWSAHKYQITGASTNDTFLTIAQWTLVQSYVLAQCDKALDGVADGILEDPTLCDFDVTAIPVCNATTTDTTTCLTATQIQTVIDVFQPLYNADNELIYPPLLYGAQVDAFRLGLLSGTIQGISQDFFRGGVYNDSSFDIKQISPADYARADQLDDLHGNPSAFNADLSGFSGAGKKLMMYHGMADPMTSGYNSQRYYQKVAKTMSLSNTEIDDFLRFFRISGMAHCGVGGISGAGAWMFGQQLAAAAATNSIVDNLVSWVEQDAAPETLLGTKFWYDTPSMGIEFERAHCRYPYRTTYISGDATKPESWGCTYIDDWQACEGTTCSADGTFT